MKGPDAEKTARQKREENLFKVKNGKARRIKRPRFGNLCFSAQGRGSCRRGLLELTVEMQEVAGGGGGVGRRKQDVKKATLWY